MAEDVPGIKNPPPINTLNEYIIGSGENLPNHNMTMRGRGKFVRQSMPTIPTFRTRQEAYRYAAYLITLAENHLPDEEGSELHTFTEVLKAVQNA